jgi:hypothetical protein
MAQKSKKLKHQIESESSENTSDNINYEINNIDDDVNISQFNLNSEDLNELNEKLSDNN